MKIEGVDKKYRVQWVRLSRNGHSVGKEIRKSRRAERHSRHEILCRRERLTRKGNFSSHAGLIDFLYCLVFSARVVPPPFRDGCEWFVFVFGFMFVRPWARLDVHECHEHRRAFPGVHSDIVKY
jgi:hypothetical protein